jgi:hypothetical protein
MSQLDANALKNGHIVYIGYISGLMLGDRALFATSHCRRADRTRPGRFQAGLRISARRW